MRQRKTRQNGRVNPVVSVSTEEFSRKRERGTAVLASLVRIVIVLVVSGAVVTPAALCVAFVPVENDTSFQERADNPLTEDEDLMLLRVDEDDRGFEDEGEDGQGGVAEDREEEEEKTDKKKKKKKKKRRKKKKRTRGQEAESEAEADDPDLAYVKETLKDYLGPQEIKWHKDGTVTLVFDFTEKSSDQAEAFFPVVQKDIRKNFRWSVLDEEWSWWGGRHGRGLGDGGLRMSDKGRAVLKCWFVDDVEAEVFYGVGSSFDKKNVGALAFFSKKGDALAANMGSQCVKYKRGRPSGKRGKLRGLDIYQLAKFKLKVKEGKFASYLEDKKKAEMTYRPKKFALGRVGFIWGGRMAGMAAKLIVRGRIAAAVMAKEIKKQRR